jgi:type IV pilus assembly protein PilN
MKLTVNLASRPFVELRPFFLRLRIIMGVLAVVSIGLAFGVHSVARKLHKAQAEMAELHNATVKAQQEKNSNEARMHQPGNAEVLDRAHFLNGLFLRKSFSWTAVMMDLENVLPVGVQITSIEPQVTAEGDVIIRLRVGGDRDRAVQLVRNLERSRRFLQPRLAGESSQAKEGNAAQQANPALAAGVEFDILASYNPLPANESFHYPKAKAAPQSSAPITSPSPRRVSGSAMNPNGAYPRNGVVLPPYSARPATTTPAAVQPTTPQPVNALPLQQRPRRPFGPGMQPPPNGGNQR